MDIEPGHGAYLVPTVGLVLVNDTAVSAREGVALLDEALIEVEALSSAELDLVVASGAA